MNDLIRRQAAIDALAKFVPHAICDESSESYTNGLTDAYNLICQLPSAQQWIPCSERLPEKSGRYLVTRGLNACGSLWNRIYISNYSDLMGIKSEKIWWQGNVGKPDFKRLDDLIAWMPLPEPYKT